MSADGRTAAGRAEASAATPAAPSAESGRPVASVARRAAAWFPKLWHKANARAERVQPASLRKGRVGRGPVNWIPLAPRTRWP